MNKKDLFFIKFALINFVMFVLLLINFLTLEAFQKDWFIYSLPALVILISAWALTQTKDIPIILVRVLQYLMPVVFLGIISIFVKFSNMH